MKLLHLVSEQTMQNLLPVLALRPAVIFQVRSSDEKFGRIAEALHHAVDVLSKTSTYHGYLPEFREIVIDARVPTVEETRHKISEALANQPDIVVNLTGGTKLMSIGAWEAAEEYHRPTLYCDTQQQRFIWEGSRANIDIPPFTEVAMGIKVDAALSAAGLDFSQFHFESSKPALDDFARAAARVSSWPSWVNERTKRFRRPDGKTIIAKGEIRTELQIPIGSTPEDLQSVTSAAVACGAMRKQGECLFLSPDPETFGGNSDRLRRAVEDNLRLLQGGWFEIAVELALRGSGRFTDIRRGLATSRNTALGETDILAFDARKVGLVVISCKSSDQRLSALEHLSELHHRARRLGGPFARAALVLGRAVNDNKLGDLVTFARALGMAVYVGCPDEQELSRLASDSPRDPLYWGDAYHRS